MSLWLGGPDNVEQGGSAAFGDVDIAGYLTVAGPTVLTDLQVTGTTTTINSVTTTITDPIVDIGAQGVAAAETGIRALDPAGTTGANQQLVYESARAAWTAGTEGAEKVLTVREDSPTDSHALIWDSIALQAVGEPDKINTYFVDAAGDDTHDGLTPASAFLTIAAATAVAVSGDSIILSPNDFTELVVLPDGVDLRGIGAHLIGSGTVLELGDDSCVTIAGITCTGGRAVNLNQAAGSARADINRIVCTGTGDASRCQAGSLDLVCASIVTVDGDVVSETNSDRIDITVSRIEVTGSGDCFRAINAGEVTVNAGNIICGTGVVFGTNNPSASSITVICARLEAANLSNIGSSVAASLTCTSFNGTLLEPGIGNVVVLTPRTTTEVFVAAGFQSDLIVEGTVGAGVTVDGVLCKDGDITVDGVIAGTSGDLTVTAAGSMIFTCTGAAATDVPQFRTGNGSVRAWTIFGREDGTGNVVGLGNDGGTPHVVGLNSTLTAYQNIKVGNEPANLELAGLAITIDGDTTVAGTHTFTANAVTADTITLTSAAKLLRGVTTSAHDIHYQDGGGAPGISVFWEADAGAGDNGWQTAWSEFASVSGQASISFTTHGGRWGAPTESNSNFAISRVHEMYSPAGNTSTSDFVWMTRGVYGTVTYGQLPTMVTPATEVLRLTDAIEATAEIKAAAGVSFNGGADALNTFIDSTTESLTYSGPNTSAAANVFLTRIGPIVHLMFDLTALTGNSTGATIAVTAISTNFRPVTAQHLPLIIDPGDGTSVMGSVMIATGGTMTIYPTPEVGDTFNTAGTIGWNAQTISFNAAAT